MIPNGGLRLLRESAEGVKFSCKFTEQKLSNTLQGKKQPVMHLPKVFTLLVNGVHGGDTC